VGVFEKKRHIMFSVLLVGCGKMGGAMLEGWLDRGVPARNIRVIEASEELRAAIESDHDVRTYENLEKVGVEFKPDVVVVAVKPQMVDSVLPDFVGLVERGAVFLSLCAGKTIASFKAILGEAAPVVRGMPNTPAAVRRGMTVGVASSEVSEEQKEACQFLMEAVGEAAWVHDESMMDAVTAVSGSGPAYVFHMTECLAKAGVAAGLPEDLAAKLAHTTITGAGALMYRCSDAPAQLRENVTSKGGTTQAALEVLMDNQRLQNLMEAAVAAAAERSRELSE
jgi:pyrroline-5-carboxylate reductase